MPRMNEELRNFVAAFQGQRCWGFAAGRGTGTAFSLKIGEKIKYSRPIDNPTLSEDVKNYNGRFGVFAVDCDWNIRRGEEIVASCGCPNDPDGEMLSALKLLVDREIVKISAGDYDTDLTLEFEGGIQLELLCLVDDEPFTNYTLFHYSDRISADWISIDEKMEIRKGQRS